MAVMMLVSLLPAAALAGVCEDGTCSHKAAIGDEHFETLQAAVDSIEGTQETTIRLLGSCEGDGVIVGPTDGGKNIVFDFGGETYTISGRLVGSRGTETNGFQLLKGNSVTFRNGTLTTTSDAVGNIVENGVYRDVQGSAKILIQNYGNLTFEDMQLSGGSETEMVSSNNCGVVKILGSTSIHNNGKTAMDACYWPASNDTYIAGTQVTVNTTGTIDGDIELGIYGTNGSVSGWETIPTILTVESGTILGNVSTYTAVAGAYRTGHTAEENAAKAKAMFVVKGGTFKDIAPALEAGAPGAIVTLADNLEIERPIVTENPVTLNLNEKVLTNHHRMNSAADRFSLLAKADLTIENGTYISSKAEDIGDTDTRGICANGGSLTLRNAVIESDGVNICLYADGKELNIENCQISGLYAVASFAENGKVKITDSELTASEQGLYHNGSYAGAVLNVSGTAISGGTDAANPDHKGVYISGSQDTTNRAGKNQQATFTNCTISGASGIETKFTDLKLENCTVSTNLSKATYVQNNNGSTANGFAVVATDNSMIPNDPQVTGIVTISGGAYKGLIGLVDFIGKGTEAEYRITAGDFTEDPTAYIAEERFVVASKKAGYVYEVTAERPAAAPIVVEEKTTAGIGGILTDADSEKLEKVLDKASVDGLSDTIKDSAKDTLLREASVDKSALSADDIVKVEIHVTVTAAAASISGVSQEEQTLTFEALPTATVKVNGNVAESGIAVPNQYLNGQKFKIALPIPEGFVPKEILHLCTDGSRERFLDGNDPANAGKKVFTIENGCAVIEISKFSSFIMNGSTSTAAKIGTNEYGTLQEAIDAASSGQTITLTANCDEAVTVSGKSLKIDCGSYSYDAAKVSLGTGCTKSVSGISGTDQVIEITYRRSSGGGGGSAVLDYSIEIVGKPENGTVAASAKSAEKGDTVTITVTPDLGYELGQLTAVAKNGDKIPLTKKSEDQYTFTMPASKVEIQANFVETRAEENPFIDVADGDYFSKAVLWAVGKGITSGTSAVTFSPNEPCTRAQMVTFLYRAAGSPETAVSADFTDVAADAYYAKAVSWAAKQGIAAGTGNGMFSPDAPCMRGQMAAFLYRFMKTPAVSGENPFADVENTDYFYNAVLWAYENKITTGTGDAMYSPDDACTRGQMVTFLYRLLQD